MRNLMAILAALILGSHPLLAQSDVVFTNTSSVGLPNVTGSLKVKIANLLGSSAPDVLVTGFDFTLVYENLGGGTFAAPQSIFNSAPSFVEAVAVGDLDGNGFADIALATAGNVRILLRQGTGWSDAFYALSATPQPGGLSGDLHIIDIDGDGDLDVLRHNNRFLGDGTGALTIGPSLQLPTVGLRGRDFADFDLDGDLDVASHITENGLGRIIVNLNDGTGTFGNSKTIGTIQLSAYGDIFARDFTGDARPDVAISAGILPALPVGNTTWDQVFEATAVGTFIPKAPMVTAGPANTATAAADLDGDGDIDLVGAGSSAFSPTIVGELRVRRNRGNGSLESGGLSTFPGAGVPSSNCAVADLNADGILDLAAAGPQTVGGPPSLQIYASATVPAAAAPNYAIAVSGGNNQLIAPGVTSPQPLSVTVTDTSGNPVANAPVTFYESTPGARSIVPWTTVILTNGSGVASINVVARSEVGPFTISAFAVPGTEANFSESVGAVQQVVVVSGNNQATDAGEQFRDALVARVLDTTGNPVSGFPVTFTIPFGIFGSIVEPQPVLTDSQGYASIHVNPGTAGGTFPVQVQSGTSVASFSLFGRKLAATVTTSTSSIFVSYLHEHTGQPVALALDAPQASPVVTPFGNLWTTIMTPGPSLTVIDPFGSFGFLDPLLFANPTLTRFYSYPPFLSGITRTIQAYGFDPFYAADVSLAIFVSNPVTVTF